MSHSDRGEYESAVEIESAEVAGVRFAVERMSFGRRLELIRQLKGLLGRLEFAAAAPEGPEKQAETALASGEIDRVYLRWGLRWVRGLRIDGEEATAENLAERGPEGLVREILRAVRREAGLSESERKNSGSPSISSGETGPDGSATSAAG